MSAVPKERSASGNGTGRPLAGQTALITGAGRGIGRAIAIRFAAAGAAVTCCARTAREIEETVEFVRSQGGRALGHAADVRDAEAMVTLAQAAVEHTGRLDLAVLNAGVSPDHAPVDAIAPDVWRECLDVNLTGVYLGLRAVAPHMRAAGGGRVLVLGSGASRRAPAGVAAYAAAKAGLTALVRAAARDLRPDGIAVNELQPGPTATAMHGVREPDPGAAGEPEATLEDGLERDPSIAGEWFKSPATVAEFALTVMVLPAAGPSGQMFSLNSPI